MADDRIAALEARISRLESERRRPRLSTAFAWLALVVLAAMGGLGVVYAQGSASRESVEAREFIIRDESGNMVFYVGPEADGAVLFLRNHQGRVTARLPWANDIVWGMR